MVRLNTAFRKASAVAPVRWTPGSSPGVTAEWVASPGANARSVEGPCKRGDSILRFLRLGLCPPCLAQLRASSIATPDDGARCGRRQCVPPMERREAQGPSHGPVRPGIPTALKRLGSRKHDAQAGLANRPKGADRKAPEAPPGAPFPSFEGKRKTGRRARPGARNQNHGTAERWLKRNLAEMECCGPHRRCHTRAAAMSAFTRVFDALWRRDPGIHQVAQLTTALRKTAAV